MARFQGRPGSDVSGMGLPDQEWKSVFLPGEIRSPFPALTLPYANESLATPTAGSLGLPGPALKKPKKQTLPRPLGSIDCKKWKNSFLSLLIIPKNTLAIHVSDQFPGAGAVFKVRVDRFAQGNPQGL